MADLDGNTWYQMTESRVNFTSGLYYNGNGALYFASADTTNMAMYWQIYHLKGGNFQFRNRNSNVKQQMGVCYVANEDSPSKTQPCMEDSNETPGQKWSMDKWADGTYRIKSVANGTNYNLDWHPGNPGFLSPTTADTPKQPAQHWMFQSIGVVEDGIYSTSVVPTKTGSTPSATPGAASASATNSSTSSPTTPPAAQKSTHSSLSGGAAAGIGIGVALAVLAVAALAFFLIRRKRKQRRWNATELPASMPYGGTEPRKVYEKSAPVHEAPSNPPHYEMYSEPSELSSEPASAMRSSNT